MTTIELTPAEVAAWADVPEGNTFWIVRKGDWRWVTVDYDGESAPPVEFVQACAPCETCGGGSRLPMAHGTISDDPDACPSCRIELVGPCLGRNQPDHVGFNCPSWCTWGCNGTGTVTLGHAYAVGQPQQTDDGKWAVELRRA